MKSVRTACVVALASAVALAVAPSVRAQASGAQSTTGQSQAQEPQRFDTSVVVTASRTQEKKAQAPASIVVITGETLQARGAQTLSDALAFLPGLEISHGADEGPQGTGVSLWGLREFDAYAIFIDGVPVGGAYNPNTAYVPIEDIDRIEVQKGPNAVLYGQTAFAGVIQVFTKTARAGHKGEIAGGGGSLGQAVGSGSIDLLSGSGRLLRMSFYGRRSSGWQPRAGEHEERFDLNYAKPLAGGGEMRIIGMVADRTQGFGAPYPRKDNSADLFPGVSLGYNYAVTDAEVADRLAMGIFHLDKHLGNNLSFVNTSSVSFDNQRKIRSFVTSIDSVPFPAAGQSLFPKQLDIFEDAHLEWRQPLAGRHSLFQAGGSYQYGRIEAPARLFDYQVSPGNPNPPSSTSLAADETEYFNRRDFAGVYAYEEVDALPRLTLSGGVRVDMTREHQRIGGDLPGEAGIDDSATHTAASYKGAATLQLVTGQPYYANLFGSYNHAFKPAAVNFGEPDAAHPILKPETADAVEGGVKIGTTDGRVDLEASVFRMNFKNLVVSQVSSSGAVTLLNAGAERFQGFEFDGGFVPVAGVPLHLSVGYAYHNPIFTSFTTVNEAGDPLVLDGKHLELAPKNLVTAAIDYGRTEGWGGFLALHAATKRPIDRRNTAYAPGYTVLDGGLSYGFGRYRIVGSLYNLTDTRYITAESELADAQVYFNAPRRGSVELRVSF